MNRHLCLPLLWLGLGITQTVQAGAEPEWRFSLDGSYLRESYQRGTLTTWEARINPGVQWGAMNLYLDIPWYGKEADFSGVVSLTGPRGRVLATRAIRRNEQFEGMGDVTAGLSYELATGIDALEINTGLSFKSDTGDAGQLMGSDTRDTSLTLDGNWHFDAWTLEAGVGHTWSESPASSVGSKDHWLFWNTGLTHAFSSRLSASLRWTDQQPATTQAPDQGMARLTLDWAATEQWMLHAGYGRHNAGQVTGQPESEITLGLSWQP